jgi:hypothetical protein
MNLACIISKLAYVDEFFIESLLSKFHLICDICIPIHLCILFFDIVFSLFCLGVFMINIICPYLSFLYVSSVQLKTK